MNSEEHKIKITIKKSKTSGEQATAKLITKRSESEAFLRDMKQKQDLAAEHTEVQEYISQIKTAETKRRGESLPKPVQKKSLVDIVRGMLRRKIDGAKNKKVPKEVKDKKSAKNGFALQRIVAVFTRQFIKTKITKPAKKKKASPSTLFAGFSIKELTHFTKRLAFLIRSGVPILESLQLLHKQNRSSARGKILESVVDDVANGRTLSAGLGRYPKIFGNFTINVIRVGEMSGTLSQNLAYLALELEKRNVLKRKVIGALVYPAFITVATISIATLLTVFIFPKVMPIFISLNVKLPFTTRVLLFMSDFLRTYGLYVLGGLIVLGVAYFFALRKSDALRYFVARNILRLPLFGRLVQNYNMTNFSRTLSLLLRSGFNLSESLTVTADSTPNPVFKLECMRTREGVIKGERISQHFEKIPKLFPDMVSHMVAIGEKSGTLSDSLMYLAEHYEAEVDDTVKNLSSSIEPVLMIFMGLIVGFVAVSIITPIY